MYRDGYKVSKIMEKFGICRMNVHQIGKNERWTHVILDEKVPEIEIRGY